MLNILLNFIISGIVNILFYRHSSPQEYYYASIRCLLLYKLCSICIVWKHEVHFLCKTNLSELASANRHEACASPFAETITGISKQRYMAAS